MGYIATIFVMIKTNIGLGVLAMPFLFNVIGMVPGILLFGFMGVIFICEPCSSLWLPHRDVRDQLCHWAIQKSASGDLRY